MQRRDYTEYRKKLPMMLVFHKKQKSTQWFMTKQHKYNFKLVVRINLLRPRKFKLVRLNNNAESKR